MSSNVRFLRSAQNYARRTSETVTTPILINGNGAYSGAPAIVQDAQFPMLNALFSGRTGRVWDTGPTPANFGGDTIFEIDLVSQRAVLAIGVLGIQLHAGGLFPQSVAIEYLTGSTYSTIGWNASIGTVTATSVGNGGRIITPVTARFWRFRFPLSSVGTGFRVAGFVLHTTVTDLGFLYSGADETRVLPRTLVEGYSRQATITHVGPEYRRWALRYDNNDATLRSTFDALYSDTEPFVFITPDDAWNECVWDSEEFMRSHVWSPPDRYRLTAELRSLS